MVGRTKTYLRYASGPDSGVVCSPGALMLSCVHPSGARHGVVAVAALEFVNLWNSRTGALITRLGVPEARLGAKNEVTAVMLVPDPASKGSDKPRWILAAGYGSGNVAMWRGDGLAEWEICFFGLSQKPDTAVLALALDATGTLLACGGQDNDLTLWDTTTMEPEYRFTGHRGAIVACSFIPGSTGNAAALASTDPDAAVTAGANLISSGASSRGRVVTGAADGLVKVFDLDVQQCVQTVVVSDTQVTSLVVDSACKRVLVGVRDNYLKVYSTEGATGDDVLVDHGVVQRKTNKPPTAMAFSADGMHLCVTSAKTVEVFRAQTDAQIKKRVQRRKKRRRDAEEKDRKELQQKRKGQKLEDGAEVKTAWDDDEDDSAKRTAADEFQSQRIFHFEAKLRGAVFAPAAAVAASTTNGAGAQLSFAVATSDNAVELHSASVTLDDDEDEASEKPAIGDLRLIRAVGFGSHAADVKAAVFTDRDAGLLTVCQNAINVWTTKNAYDHQLALANGESFQYGSQRLTCTATIPAGDVQPTACVALPGGEWAVAATATGQLMILSLPRAEVVDLLPAHEGAITGLAVREGGAGIVTCGKDRRVVQWDLALTEKKKAPKTADAATAAAAAGGGDVTFTVLQESELSEAPVALNTSPDGKLIAVALQDSNVQVLFADTLKPFLVLYGHKLPVQSIAFSSDSSIIATAGMDKSLRFWGADFGDCHRAIHAHDDYITSVRFVPETHYVFTSSLDGTVKYWDGDYWTLVQVLKIHQHGVWGLTVNSDGTCVATCGADRNIRTIIRTEEVTFPSEEEEKRAQEAMEDEEAKKAALQRLDDAVVGDIATAGQKTAKTAEAAENLMEALDIVSVELQRLSDPEARNSAGNPLLRERSPWQYLYGVIESIRPSELRHALSSLTSIHMTSLLTFLPRMIDAGVVSNFELLSRLVLAAVKPAPGSNTPALLTFSADDDALRTLAKLKTKLAAGLGRDVDRFGLNVAGLQMVKTRVAAEGKVRFHDVSKVQGAKRKWHDKKLTADE